MLRIYPLALAEDRSAEGFIPHQLVYKYSSHADIFDSPQRPKAGMPTKKAKVDSAMISALMGRAGGMVWTEPNATKGQNE